MEKIIVVALLMTLSCVLSKSLGNLQDVEPSTPTHSLKKRFINPIFALGSNSDSYGRMRTKRSIGEECEKLQLCKLHASSSRSFIAAFELYFVNKENARLWDHRSRSMADCERRFKGCYYR